MRGRHATGGVPRRDAERASRRRDAPGRRARADARKPHSCTENAASRPRDTPGRRRASRGGGARSAPRDAGRPDARAQVAQHRGAASHRRRCSPFGDVRARTDAREPRAPELHPSVQPFVRRRECEGQRDHQRRTLAPARRPTRPPHATNGDRQTTTTTDERPRGARAARATRAPTTDPTRTTRTRSGRGERAYATRSNRPGDAHAVREANVCSTCERGRTRAQTLPRRKSEPPGVTVTRGLTPQHLRVTVVHARTRWCHHSARACDSPGGEASLGALSSVLRSQARPRG
jgi:hypothetical protein